MIRRRAYLDHTEKLREADIVLQDGSLGLVGMVNKWLAAFQILPYGRWRTQE